MVEAMDKRSGPVRPTRYIERNNPDYLRAPGDHTCCIGASFTEGERCTCWEQRTDTPQEPLQEGPMPVRRKACVDCAYRAGSPERVRDGGEIPEYDLVRPFACHQGMPLVVEIVHPPSGESRVPEGDSYQPVQREGRAWLADGRPAEWCAGWAAVNGVGRRADR